MEIRVFTAFSGYDSQCMALDRLHQHNPDFTYELVGWAEIDKYAIQAHNAVYPQWADRNLGDMTKIDWSKVEPIDLLTYSTPCQSISNAGLQHGFTEGSGTRSSIIWNVRDAVKALHPKYLMLENVKAMVEEKFLPMFNLWRTELVRLGYDNYAPVLNAKDYGIPQNRERIFMVSILDPNKAFYWPEPFKLEKRLKDVLEQNVDEKYYLSDKLVNYVFSNGGVNKNIQGG
jgi:DNA (cytosine-5)-methyltransferase 1